MLQTAKRFAECHLGDDVQGKLGRELGHVQWTKQCFFFIADSIFFDDSCGSRKVLATYEINSGLYLFVDAGLDRRGLPSAVPGSRFGLVLIVGFGAQQRKEGIYAGFEPRSSVPLVLVACAAGARHASNRTGVAGRHHVGADLDHPSVVFVEMDKQVIVVPSQRGERKPKG